MSLDGQAASGCTVKRLVAVVDRSRDRQAGVPRERGGQVRSATDPLDPLVSLVDDLGETAVAR
jgi:hypothetical protein